MTLATFAALDALADALADADDLPPVKHNDTAFEGFTPSPGAGCPYKLVLEEGAISVREFEMGQPPAYELDVQATLILAVEGANVDTRNAVVRAGLASIAGVLMPYGRGLRIAGKFEDLEIRGTGREIIHETGRLPIDITTITLGLFVTAPTPFG